MEAMFTSVQQCSCGNQSNVDPHVSAQQSHPNLYACTQQSSLHLDVRCDPKECFLPPTSCSSTDLKTHSFPKEYNLLPTSHSSPDIEVHCNAKDYSLPPTFHSLFRNKDEKKFLTPPQLTQHITQPSPGPRLHSSPSEEENLNQSENLDLLDTFNLLETDPFEISQLWDTVRSWTDDNSNSLVMMVPISPTTVSSKHDFSSANYVRILASHQITIDDLEEHSPLLGNTKLHEIITEICPIEERHSSNVKVWNEARVGEHVEKMMKDIEEDGRSWGELTVIERFCWILNNIFDTENVSTKPRTVRHFYSEDLFKTYGKDYESFPLTKSHNTFQATPTLETEKKLSPSTISKSSAPRSPTSSRTGHISEGAQSSQAPGNSKTGKKPPSKVLQKAQSCSYPSQSSIAPLPQISASLEIPFGDMDLAYWLPIKECTKNANIIHSVFVTKNAPQATLPYLSAAFYPKSLFVNAKEKLHIKHKIVVYGAFALYNRFKLYQAANKKRGSNGIKNTSLLHFGIAIFSQQAVVYAFRCKESDNGAVWRGCMAMKLRTFDIMDRPQLKRFYEVVEGIRYWGAHRYLNSVQEDMKAAYD